MYYNSKYFYLQLVDKFFVIIFFILSFNFLLNYSLYNNNKFIFFHDIVLCIYNYKLYV